MYVVYCDGCDICGGWIVIFVVFVRNCYIYDGFANVICICIVVNCYNIYLRWIC
jgi:hypothetical protein